ncbi:hypothetical protein [Cohnella soli]|uniref:Uncharacterized protein n=1 Tax=Cohnella soli TaxID=425005 RepID=A0ABW0HZZ4_9BACL
MKWGMRVQIWLKVIWSFASLFSLFSLLWFILGATANFQRSLDLVSSVTLVFVGIPTFVITVLSIRLLFKGWIPTGGGMNVGLYSGILILFALSAVLIKSVHTEGWLSEKVTSDSIKYTLDNKYEYRIELINLFQKNSWARLLVKSVTTKEVKTIPVDIPTDRIAGIGTKKVNNWVWLEASEVLNHYTLFTTKELGIPEMKFDIDIASGTSQRLE